MKNTKVVAAALIAMLSVLATDCGKRADSAEVQSDNNTDFKMQIDTVINKTDDSGIGEDQAEESDGEIAKEPVKYDCMDEIKAASPDSGLVQIDDMILQYGAKFSEIANVIEQSECTYEAEYNASSVVPAGEEVAIQFNKDGERYFMIFVENRESETIELKDCITYSIRASQASMNVYYAGCGDEEVTYTTVKDAMKDYELESEILGTGAHGKKELGVRYEIPFQESEMYIYFIFDGITNDIVKFEISSRKFVDAGWPW